ncbi:MULTISPECIES: hypothetical protein [Pseudomonas]|jgi:hypothetical protein|uniref:Uncharacterized protein n=1 Tax=Pseudomonas mosselii TaxID=78327 RepID=A0A5R8Z2N0_9PSED|nr:hypothetical protein [Pseudomonas mosselii]TLP60082.1 hypothetical protein FEM01_12830 [Pseudomonas mosselii]
MSGINLNTATQSHVQGATVVRRSAEVLESAQAEKPRPEESADELKLSALSQQLSAAAQRAAERDQNLTRDELSVLAKKILDKVFGSSYVFNKLSYDNYRPNTDDPELLARAQQATDFANGKAKNPFADLTHEQLTFITYDEGGEFTVNERHAAATELSGRYEKWSVYITQKMEVERQLTGRNDEGLKEILSYYKALPAIEEAQLLAGYETSIMMQMEAQEIDWPTFNTSLIDMLANEWKPAEPPVTPEQPDPVADHPGKAPN